MKMKIFTVESGKITEGARVDTFTLKGAGVSIPAIIVGEEGRGRKLGVLPVQLLPAQYKEWQENGYTYIHSATVGTTKAGKPKLFQTENADTEKCICIAQGAAGRMGSGKQLVAIMPAGIVFRTGYSGRLYGAPSEHYYIYRDGQLLSATWDEREASDIF